MQITRERETERSPKKLITFFRVLLEYFSSPCHVNTLPCDKRTSCRCQKFKITNLPHTHTHTHKVVGKSGESVPGGTPQNAVKSLRFRLHTTKLKYATKRSLPRPQSTQPTGRQLDRQRLRKTRTLCQEKQPQQRPQR